MGNDLEPGALKQAAAFLAEPVEAASSRPLRALWYACHGYWDTAHEEAQVSVDDESCWVHAVLHRAEGDAANAAYWYHKAGKPVFKGSVEEEREQILASLLPQE